MSEVILTICEHASGRRTLTQRVDGGPIVDLGGPLFANGNKVEFDRDKERLVADLRGQGNRVLIEEKLVPVSPGVASASGATW